MKVALSFDLGSDTLKVAYSYKDGKTVKYGKIIRDDLINQVALSASALYDMDINQWIYSDDINDGSYTNFIRTVKIKTLLNLLNVPPRSVKRFAEVYKNNQNYYYNEHHFPKFYFPIKKQFENDFGLMVSKSMTFIDEKRTPQNVVYEYFEHIKEIVEKRLEVLEVERGLFFSRYYDISVIVPATSSNIYKDELSTIFKTLFINKTTGAEPIVNVVTAPKAIGLLAYHLGKIKQSQSMLVFDMGEEKISVVKTRVNNDTTTPGVVVEGTDGHSKPIDIGGNDFDEAIVDYLEKAIQKKETVGTPSSDESGHIAETSLYSKQYLLMNDIKKAKMILSDNTIDFQTFFGSGVPINIYRETLIQRSITKEQFLDIVGITKNNGVVRKIYEYIKDEIKLGVNRDVKDVFLSGGLIETYGLFDYIKEQLVKDQINVNLIELDEIEPTYDLFALADNDNSTYAAAIGGAVALTCGYSVDTALALSYCTWLSDDQTKVLAFLVNKGTTINSGLNQFTIKYNARSLHSFSDCINKDEILSTHISEEEVKAQTIGPIARYSSRGRLLIYEPDSIQRKGIANLIGLKLVSGGVNGAKSGKILFKFKDRYISYCGEVAIIEGVEIDAEGNSRPIILNNKEANKNKTTKIRYKGSTQDLVVKSTDISLEFEGLGDFNASIG